MSIKFYNTKNRAVEEFKPINPKKVGMYACGMTVYDYAHIGHGRKYVMDDILRRTLQYIGYEVNHVQNVTDVGHLSADEDFADDKLEKGAEKSGMDVWQTAKFFTDDFYLSMSKLNILEPNIISKATSHIDEQIKMIEKILENGFAYDTPEAVYFDVSKYPDYEKFSGQKLSDKKVAVREDVDAGLHKKNSSDFVLWFKNVGKYENHIMHWESPWGVGFPGWHIECSAMSTHYLGDLFDIHTGGIDHVSVHHPNEIAEAYGALGTTLANYWLHTDFLTVDGQKMSKSVGNIFRVEDVEKKGFSPLSLRYLYLGANYRSKLNFTWQSLEASENALNKIFLEFQNLPESNDAPDESYIKKFEEAIFDDLNTPMALSYLHEVIKNNDLADGVKRATLLTFDKILGLGLNLIAPLQIPEEILKLKEQREEARKNKDWTGADIIREKIKSLGYSLEDGPNGVRINKI